MTDAAWTVKVGQGLLECAQDPAHAIPRMEAGGRGVWDWRLVPTSNARGWEARSWAYNAGYEAEGHPGLNVDFGWFPNYTAKYAQLMVNTNSTDWTIDSVTIGPGECYFHPERSEWHVISFTPFETGTYAVGGFLRHWAGDDVISWGSRPDKLTVELRCGGRTLYSATGRGMVFDFAQASVACRSGESIELWIRVAADWSNHCCHSSMDFEVSQLGTSGDAAVWRVNDALKAICSSDTPTAREMSFADGTGIRLGAATNGLFDAFVPMKYVDKDNSTRKWYMTLSDYSKHPWISGGTGEDDTFKLFPGRHKIDTEFSHVKIGWTAPADGLYRTSGFMAHVGGHSGTWGTSPTLEGAVLLAEDGQIHRYGTFHNTTSAAVGTGMGMDAGRLWLRKGETLWFAAGPTAASRETNYMADMTARLTVAKDDIDAFPSVVAFDFGAPGAEGYAGRGVEGFADTARWNRFAVAAGATVARFDSTRQMDGKLTGVKLELAPIDEGTSLATGTADDSACALYGDGVASASTAAVVNWTLSGLVKGTTYTLTFYGLAPCVFTVGSEIRVSPATSGKAWMTVAGGEYCQTTVTATGRTLTGQFYSSSSDAQALWTGLQVSGESFAEHSGFAIRVR